MHPLMFPLESPSLNALFHGDWIGFLVYAAMGMLSFLLFYKALFWVSDNGEQIIKFFHVVIIIVSIFIIALVVFWIYVLVKTYL